jgi:hypothetical protein
MYLLMSTGALLMSRGEGTQVGTQVPFVVKVHS